MENHADPISADSQQNSNGPLEFTLIQASGFPSSCCCSFFVVITIILSLTKFCCKALKRLNQTPGGGQLSPQVSLFSYILLSPLPIFFLANLLLWDDDALIFQTVYCATILVSF